MQEENTSYVITSFSHYVIAGRDLTAGRRMTVGRRNGDGNEGVRVYVRAYACKCDDKCKGHAEVELTLPSAPSAQSSMRFTPARAFLVGHTSASAAQVVVCSPVAGLHLSEQEEKGMRIVDHASPAGTENFALKQPREKGIEPPPAQE